MVSSPLPLARDHGPRRPLSRARRNRSWLAAALWAGVLLLGLAGGYVAYALLVPPFGDDPVPLRPSIAKVLDDQNGWREYAEALNQLPPSRPAWLAKVGEAKRLSNEQLVELRGGSETIRRVLGAVRRPGWQTAAEAPTLMSRALPLATVRHPLEWTLAWVVALEQAGRADEALEIKASLYRIASAFAEPHADLVPVLVAASMRRSVQQQLVLSASKGNASVPALLEAARRMEALDAAFPTLAQAHEANWVHWERGWEDVCIRLRPIEVEGRAGAATWAAFPRAARRRVFRGIVREGRRVMDEVRPALERWDFAALATLDELLRPRLRARWKQLERPFLGEIVGARILAIGFPPSFGDTAHSLYVDRTAAVATRVMLVASASRRLRGEYPVAVEPVFEEFGLRLPVDPAGLPLRYRLEAGRPVVWFPGPDGRDNGGLLEARPGATGLQEGTDLVYRLDG